MEWDAAQLEIERTNMAGSSGRQFCPECGALMVEADRVNESGAVYVWYDCSESDCSGSWLKKL